MIDIDHTPEITPETDKEALTHEALNLADVSYHTSLEAVEQRLGHDAVAERPYQAITETRSNVIPEQHNTYVSPEQLANQNVMAMILLIGAGLARFRKEEIERSYDLAA